MVSEYEALILQRDMRRELDGSSRAVEKCAAGLVLLALIAVIGASSGRDGAGLEMAAVPEATPGYELKPVLD